jgi:hypothetical protein
MGLKLHLENEFADTFAMKDKSFAFDQSQHMTV